MRPRALAIWRLVRPSRTSLRIIAKSWRVQGVRWLIGCLAICRDFDESNGGMIPRFSASSVRSSGADFLDGIFNYSDGLKIISIEDL